MAEDLLTLLDVDPQPQREEVEEEILSFDVEQVKIRGYTDLNFFAALTIPQVYRFEFSPIYIALWQLLTEKGASYDEICKIALGLPRGFAKTTFLKLVVIWLILYSTRQFFLIVCNAEPLAFNFLSDIADMLSSENIKKVYGDWRYNVEKDSEQVKKFHYHGRSITLIAIGAGSSFRGLNIRHMRPDVILMDDIQKKEEAENPILAEKLLVWFIGTLMKAKSPFRCLFVYLGNMYPFPGSILKKLKHNASWISFIAGGILDDGESLWPQLRSKDSLINELLDDISLGHPEVFFAEVLNDEEAGSRSGIDVSKIPAYPLHLHDQESEGGFIIIDLAGGRQKSDDCAIEVYLMFSGVPVFRQLVTGNFSPKETILICLRLAITFKIKLITAESNAYQTTFHFWFLEVCRDKGLSGAFAIEPLQAHGLTKNKRIKAALNKLPRSEIILHPEVRGTVIYQIVYWNPLKKENVDDIIDGMGYVDQVIENYSHLIIRDEFVELENLGVKTLLLEEMVLEF